MVSIIVPVFNEEDQIKDQITSLLQQELCSELIIVDGGCTDRTLKLVECIADDRVQIICAEKGRAKQMNAGARLAQNPYLLFLHVDTRLPNDGLELIVNQFDHKKAVAGSFYLKFNYKHPFLGLLSLFSHINNSFFTYGDQGLFVRKEIFEKIGGYKEIPIMEDLEIQKRLRSKGEFVKLKVAVVTSARRFIKQGIFWNEFKNICLVILYKLGVSPDRLSKMYR